MTALNSFQSLLFKSEISAEITVTIKLDFSKFNKEECIGKGSFGNVFKCSIPPDLKHKYAVKQIEILYAEAVIIWKKFLTLVNVFIYLLSKESNSILKEAQILKELDHKNIVKYYDVLKTSDGIYIFLEYVSKVLALITE